LPEYELSDCAEAAAPGLPWRMVRVGVEVSQVIEALDGGPLGNR
jgi:hypothetical protein